jgi:hypothetical protein
VKLTWSVSSQAIWAWEIGSLGALLVSPFHVKWRFSAPAGGMEGSGEDISFSIFVLIQLVWYPCLGSLNNISFSSLGNDLFICVKA